LLIPCRVLAAAVEAWVLVAYARRLVDADLAAAAAAAASPPSGGGGG
jgi:hypothetical protein